MEVKGSNIVTSSFQLQQGAQGAVTNEWAVNIQFDDEGTAKFKEVTERLNQFYVAAGGETGTDPKAQFAIVLDDQVISAPRSLAVITDGRPQITGGFTEQTAKALSDQLRFGALPISFEIQSDQQISATLGGEQLRMGLLAGVIGLLLVVVYSLFQYRALGFVTIASLVVAGALTYLAIAILGWTENYRLSLAGVAGLIVAIGQTADSFIVYFERIRDELREGRGLVSAVENGWKRAKRTVLASKAVNLLAALVLYFVAVGQRPRVRLYPRPDSHRRPHRGLHVHPPDPAAAGPYQVLRGRPPVLRPGPQAPRRRPAVPRRRPASVRRRPSLPWSGPRTPARRRKPSAG